MLGHIGINVPSQHPGGFSRLRTGLQHLAFEIMLEAVCHDDRE